jgi:HJR/Mrr/RecB family endonuclease
VLRHREDAARAYAFVVQTDHVSVDRITALIEQAREIGMMRVAVIAEAGYEKGAKEIAKRRHVRLIDRTSMEAELSELQLPTAAKIIAVARARSAAEPSAA